MKTTSTRVTVSTKATELVPPENIRRRITLLPPGSPQMYFAIDQTNEDIADCRTYYWVPMGTFPVPSFTLEAGQFIYAIADTSGQAPIGVICEYLEEAKP